MTLPTEEEIVFSDDDLVRLIAIIDTTPPILREQVCMSRSEWNVIRLRFLTLLRSRVPEGESEWKAIAQGRAETTAAAVEHMKQSSARATAAEAEVARMREALEIIRTENLRAKQQFTNVSNSLISRAIKAALSPAHAPDARSARYRSIGDSK